jgi:hypothetical protein
MNGVEHFDVMPPSLSATDAEIVAFAVKRLSSEYLAGKRAWEDFPGDSRPWLCHFLLALDKHDRETRRTPKGKRAAYAVDVILELASMGMALGHLDARLESDDEETRLEGARTVAAKLHRVDRDSLRRVHSRKRKG